MSPLLPTTAPLPGRILSAPEFQQLAEVSTEAQWFANIDNLQTRRAYQNDLAGFIRFAGITQPTEFRQVARSHVLAWRVSANRILATVSFRLAATELMIYGTLHRVFRLMRYIVS